MRRSGDSGGGSGAETMNGRGARDVIAGALVAALRAADPGAAVRRSWPAEDLGGREVTLLATGKASAAMTRAAIAMGARIARGVVTCVPGHAELLRADLERAGLGSVIRVYEADHPFATERNIESAQAVAEFARLAGEGEVVLGLVSGGASAHLASPAGDLTLADVRAIAGALLRSGATIREINTVRRRLETLKGGGLAALCDPARVVVLVVSDVLGDDLSAIGSGPFARDATTFGDALGVLERHRLEGVSEGVTRFLRAGNGRTGDSPARVAPEVRHVVIANNAMAVEAAAAALEVRGWRVAERRVGVEGEAKEVANHLCARVRTLGRGDALVWGGEPTVTVGDADGVGGRNQEVAFVASMALDGENGVAVASLGTDGIDGPTDAAGGVVDGATASKMRARGIDLHGALERHDSYTALTAAGALLITGPTGTNVNDVIVGLRF